jgi:hypothetical protein
MFFHVGCVGGVSRNPCVNGSEKNTRNDKSRRRCHEATKWSRVLETSILSDEMARIQCKILIRAGETGTACVRNAC